MESFHPCSKQIGRGNLEILSVSAVESAAFNQRPKSTSIQFHFWFEEDSRRRYVEGGRGFQHALRFLNVVWLALL